MQALRAKEKQIAQVKIIAEISLWYPFTHYTFAESLFLLFYALLCSNTYVRNYRSCSCTSKKVHEPLHRLQEPTFEVMVKLEGKWGNRVLLPMSKSYYFPNFFQNLTFSLKQNVAHEI